MIWPRLRQRRTPAWSPFPAARSPGCPAHCRPASPFLGFFVDLIAEVSMPARLRASVAAAVRVVGMGVRCLIGGSRKRAATRA